MVLCSLLGEKPSGKHAFGYPSWIWSSRLAIGSNIVEAEVNAEDHSREELNQLATDAGLADAAKYPDKPAVADAINRVRAGEDAAAVNAELTSSTTPNDDSGSDASNCSSFQYSDSRSS
jgi:hypothetical protein